jgi:hypothetical protein
MEEGRDPRRRAARMENVMLATETVIETVDAPPRALPAELGSALLTLATSAVPIRLVSRLAEDLTHALAGRPLADSDVVVLAALLSRAAGPWLPTRTRFAALVRQLEAVLARVGCEPVDVEAVLGDLDEAFLARRAQVVG